MESNSYINQEGKHNFNINQVNLESQDYVTTTMFHEHNHRGKKYWKKDSTFICMNKYN